MPNIHIAHYPGANMAASGDRAPIGRALRATLTGVVILGTLLLIPAGLVPGGTWLWPRGLAYLAAYGAIIGVGNLALAIWRPAHFQVRQQSVVAPREKRQPRLDAAGTVALLAFGSAWVVSIPLDVFRVHLLPAPSWQVSLAGGAVSLLGVALTPLAVWENRFTTPNVQHQSGQTIVRSGVYRLVRHPIYLGNLLMAAGATLWLGSYTGLWGFAVLLVSTVGRIAIEETHLRANFPEYADYARAVRGRLIPFVI